VVDLHGVIGGDREGDALRVLCENVPGVTHVADHLVWVDAYSGLVIGRSENEARGRATAQSTDT
jgi:hypothetical protein